MRLMKLLFPLVILLFPLLSRGQEMLGATLGNYAGTDAVQLNPSALHNSKQYLDIRILGGDIFIQNNYLYQDKNDYSLSNFFKPGYQFPTHSEDYATETRIFYTYQNKRPKNAYENIRINGPAAMLIWDRHAFEVFTCARAVTSAHNLPYDLANFIYLGLNYYPQQNINYHDKRNFSGASAEWAEIGVSYSYIIYQRNYDRIAIGTSVRRLLGYSGGYTFSKDMDYLVPDDSTMIFNNVDAQMGLSLPVNYDDNSFQSGLQFRGGGFGFDAGATYTRLTRSYTKQYTRRPCEPQYEDYLYRIGVALIDIGRINYKKNAQKLDIDNRPSYWTDLDNLEFGTVQNFLDTISYQFYGNTTDAYAGDHFKVWLPSALSAQFDYHYLGPWYFNASLIYGFNLSKASLSRPSEISITPRYETQWFEANLPVSLYDWSLMRIGLSLRFYFLTIGTEKLGQFFSFNDFTGMDLYFSIKVPFNKGKCSAKGPGGCPGMESAPRVKKAKKKKS
jgi:hypothetical protein